MLRKEDRLASKDIESLSHGKSVFGTLLSMRFSPAPDTKYAVSVSKKTCPTAVRRNGLRRKVYAAIKKAGTATKIPASIMFMPKRECFEASEGALIEEITTLSKKAGLR